MTTNTELWDQLKTVPKDAQKPFKRAGGFSGTAIKPMWTYHKMTEVFGPCGTGWGIDKPEFQVITAGDELLVYCTVTVWYGERSRPGESLIGGPPVPPSHLVGVGGDKVLSKTKYGLSTDDEAFKKAFTDAVTNALKTLGAGADIHMGVYDGKYQDRPEPAPAPVQQPKQEADKVPTITNERELVMAVSEAVRSYLYDLGLCETKAELTAWVLKVKGALDKGIISDDEYEAMRPEVEKQKAYIAEKRQEAA